VGTALSADWMRPSRSKERTGPASRRSTGLLQAAVRCHSVQCRAERVISLFEGRARWILSACRATASHINSAFLTSAGQPEVGQRGQVDEERLPGRLLSRSPRHVNLTRNAQTGHWSARRCFRLSLSSLPTIHPRRSFPDGRIHSESVCFG
jgi:hypothetical protein